MIIKEKQDKYPYEFGLINVRSKLIPILVLSSNHILIFYVYLLRGTDSLQIYSDFYFLLILL